MINKIRDKKNPKVNGDMTKIHPIEIKETCPICPICPICIEPLDENVVQFKHCTHLFHQACLTTWFEVKFPTITCPVCKASS